MVCIGAKFTGKHGFADTRTGEYWEVLPDVQGDHRLLQLALLRFPTTMRWPRHTPSMPPCQPPKQEAQP
jgi:hypothetical protein